MRLAISHALSPLAIDDYCGTGTGKLVNPNPFWTSSSSFLPHNAADRHCDIANLFSLRPDLATASYPDLCLNQQRS
jgi:hypothetical protein